MLGRVASFWKSRSGQLEEMGHETRPRIWGPFATLLWSALVILLFVVAQIVCVIFYIAAGRGTPAPTEISGIVTSLAEDGELLSLSTFATTLVTAAAVTAIIKLRRGSDLKDYLGLVLPGRRQLWQWVAAIIAFNALSDLLSIAVGKPLVPEFLLNAYSSSESTWAFWAAVVIAAPLGEELLFRGFLLRGLSASRLGAYGAVVATSVAFALMHVQYDFYGIATVIVLGLFLGMARIKTGSIFLAMIMHALANLEATAEAALSLAYASPI
ncbi:MAG: CPBP family intramembrane metalloprotease [Proteobacteria bacterium]|nr:CPBP family intramembrane metalloprotease [Pseudomonadota bacterium]